MKVLVTNDDGVHAPGLHALAAGLVADGHDVFVVAPMEDMSGSAAALGPQSSVGCDIERLVLPALGASVPVVAIDGPPGLCVLLAHLGAFGERPEIVASGINPGSNTGRAVLFSGTVGAALAGSRFGIPSVAVSVRKVDDEPLRLDTASSYAVAAVRWLAEHGRPVALNLNVPDLDIDAVRGVREGRLAHFGVVRTVISGQESRRITLVLEETAERLDDDTDTMLVRDGYVSVNSVGGPHRVPLGDGALAALASVGAAG